jgi:hypothetical protein
MLVNPSVTGQHDTLASLQWFPDNQLNVGDIVSLR